MSISGGSHLSYRDISDVPGPLVVFWGVIDRRLDSNFFRVLAREMTEGTILLVGPQDNPEPRCSEVPGVRMLRTCRSTIFRRSRRAPRC